MGRNFDRARNFDAMSAASSGKSWDDTLAIIGVNRSGVIFGQTRGKGYSGREASCLEIEG